MRLAVALMLLVLLVSGCEHYERAEDVNCDLIEDKDVADECMYNKSTAASNAALCRDIFDEDLRKKCINDVAISLLDFWPCRQHDRRPDRDRCELLVGDARKAARDEGELELGEG